MRDRGTVAEIACLTGLFGYLIWVPLPFGSASDAAFAPLVAVPLLLCAATAAATSRNRGLAPTRHGLLWAWGGALSLAATLLQLLPLPMPLLRVASPESARMWRAASGVAALAGVSSASFHPITIDPGDTTAQLFRLAAYVATFITAMLLLRSTARRLVLAVVLAAMAVFETIYAVREAALQRYAIWGWKNTLIFNRATGTFVNPNHFAHYAAIILPMAVFLCALAWHTSAPPGVPRGRHIALLIERRFAMFGFGTIAAIACVAAILISQSRGAALAAIAGFALGGGIASGRRHAVVRAALIAAAAIAVFATVFLVLSRTSEAKHLQERDVSSLTGRRSAVVTALRIWTAFPLFGSGAGTFEDLAPRWQEPGDRTLANHAHNDYAESLATTGVVGFLIGFVPLMAGTVALGRVGFGKRAAAHQSWRHRAFCGAALASIVIALLHALVDFNFYIPANPVTLAAIAGAASAIRKPEAR
jgi:O-antigen ligase